MQPVSRIDENPFRPRHFRPPPAGAPVVTDERHAALRSRPAAAGWSLVAAVFALVFLVVALRLLTIAAAVGRHGRSACRQGPPPAGRRRRRRRAPISSTATASCWRRRSTRPSLYADPRQILDAREATRAILSVLPQLNPAEVHAKLTSGKSFVWIKRRLTPTQQYRGQPARHPGPAIRARGAPGLSVRRSGLACRRVLRHRQQRSRRHRAGARRDRERAARGPLQLSLDARVQFILHEELAQGHQRFQRQGRRRHRHGRATPARSSRWCRCPISTRTTPASSIPKLPPADAKERIFNKITLGVYELGSVFKIFNTAMALDAGVATMTKQLRREPRHSNRPVHDRPIITASTAG